MKFLLTNTFEDCFEMKGKTYHINMAFDNILLLFELFDDTEILEYEKPLIALEMLIVEDLEKFESYDQAIELFKYLLKEFLDIDVDEEVESDKKKVFDFKKDAGLIYSSFMSCYRMDLFEMKGKLHWDKFNELLSNMDDESKLKQVIGFRVMEVPSSKTASKEQRDHVLKMKRVYSLEEDMTEEDTIKRVNKAFDSVSHIFKK